MNETKERGNLFTNRSEYAGHVNIVFLFSLVGTHFIQNVLYYVPSVVAERMGNASNIVNRDVFLFSYFFSA